MLVDGIGGGLLSEVGGGSVVSRREVAGERWGCWARGHVGEESGDRDMRAARVIKEDLLRLVVALEDVSRKEVDHFC